MVCRKQGVVWSFWYYIVALKIYGLVVVDAKQKTCQRILTKMQLLMWIALVIISYNNFVIVTLKYADSVINFCQMLDRYTIFGGLICVFVDSIVFSKKHFKSLNLLDEIDELLRKKFDLKIDLRKMSFYSHLIPITHLLSLILIFSRKFSYKIDIYLIINELLHYCWVIYESFYAAIVIQLIARYKYVFELLKNSKNVKIKSEDFYDIFLKSSKLIETTNDNFGFFILIACGSISLIIFPI
jgi:hypothetical protein